MKILNSLFRKKNSKESTVKYILFLLHLWFGLIAGVVISFVCITGAIYVFKTEIEDVSSKRYYKRSSEAIKEANVNSAIQNYLDKYEISINYISLPKRKDKNIKIYGGGRGADAVIAFADRETGEIIGEQSSAVSSFFFTVLKLHRWLNFKNMQVGRKITAISTIVFMLLLLSGVVLWFPRRKKSRWKNKFTLRFKRKFKVWNRDLHINLGTITAVLLLLIAWTGLYFTYPSVRSTTIGLFMTKEERIAEKEKRETQKTISKNSKQSPGKHNSQRKVQGKQEGNKEKKNHKIDYNQIVFNTNKELNFPGDITIIMPGRRSKGITVRKLNRQNILRARVYDSVIYSSKGEFSEVKTFNSNTSSQKVKMLMKSIHTGEVLGLKSKVIYFLLSIFAAYLPVSGYIMWWKKTQ